MSPRPGWLPDGRTRILGIVGSPLEHSLSPSLQTAVLRALDRNLIYLPLPVSEDRLPALLAEAPGLGILGLNVTTPYKQAMARLVRPLDEEAARTGVVNTVRLDPDGPAGCGTDGAGILEYLAEAGLDRAPFGILGFGATARSLAWQGLRRGSPPALIVTRRPAKVRSVLTGWGAPEAQVGVLGWGEFEAGDPPGRGGSHRGARPTVWVSTLRPDLPALPETFWAQGGTRTVLLDLNYGAGRTARAEEARGHGWRAADGLGPLCRQAARSLSLWLREEVPAALFFRALGRAERSLRPRR